MKSDYSKKYWQSSALGIAVLVFASSSAFAAISDCKNPTEVMLDGNVKMKFCEIPAGSAAIGSESKEWNQWPKFKRNFKSFQIGQFTVTQQEFKAVLDEEPWKEKESLKANVKEDNNNPAVYISYMKAKQFAHVMSLIDPSANYRLPTEAEFEYAARAGTHTHYYWGDDFDSNYAYYNDNTEKHAYDVTTCPVAILDQKLPGYCANDFGLMHMLGNVWQWTADAYVNNYIDAPTDGNLAVEGKAGSFRVVRGGSWHDEGLYLRSSTRLSSSPYADYSVVGFRLVRTPK